MTLAGTITEGRDEISAASQHGPSTARIGRINSQIWLIAQGAFGLYGLEALIALAMLKLADLCPPLPR